MLSSTVFSSERDSSVFPIYHTFIHLTVSSDNEDPFCTSVQVPVLGSSAVRLAVFWIHSPSPPQLRQVRRPLREATARPKYTGEILATECPLYKW